MRIYLIGFMGSGKSRAGRRLAPALRMPYIDLDERIEQVAGCSIADYFARYGEPEFRELEARCLRQTEASPAALIACGGGAPCFHDNMAWMNRAGLTIFLDPPVDLLLERLLRGRAHRPLLKSFGNRAALQGYIEDKLEQRRPYYEQAAVSVRPANEREEAADLILEHLNDIIGH